MPPISQKKTLPPCLAPSATLGMASTKEQIIT